MKIPEIVVDRIREAARIADVVGDVVALNRKGANLVGVCPFHNDSSPSLFVSPAKNIFKCFACGAGGDVIEFVMRHECLSFPEALRFLARRYSVDVPDVELSREEIEREQRREALLIILRKAQDVFRDALAHSPQAKNYLCDGRGIDPEMLDLYGVGFAPPGNGLFSRLSLEGFDPDLMTAAGVVCRQRDRGTLFDHLRDRISFPFFNLAGLVTGFSGRTLSDSPAAPKYLNTAETQLFHKGKVLFGLFQAKAEIIRRDEVFLVEGQFDVLSLAQRGVANSVCGSGTALTEDQINLLARFTRNVTLLYDGDRAGLDASFKNIRALLAHGLNVRAARLPDGDDPDSFARRLKPDGLADWISKQRKPFVRYMFDAMKMDFADPYLKEAALVRICDCIAASPVSTLRSEFIQSAAVLFGLSAAEVKANVNLPDSENADAWKPGFYGVDDALRLLRDDDDDDPCLLTFRREVFFAALHNRPVVFVHDIPSKTQIQQLRTKIGSFCLENFVAHGAPKKEAKELVVLKDLVRDGFNVVVRSDDGKEMAFVDFYILLYQNFQTKEEFLGADVPLILDRCAEMIACAEPTRRSANAKSYQNCLGLPNQKALNDILKPFLARRRDKSVLETQRLDAEADLFDFDPEKIPDYVLQDDVLSKTYRQAGFYPLLNADRLPVAYMFKNQNGGGHSCVSDFFMVPLLHVYSKDAMANKRVVQLNHLFLKKPKYVEWQSSVFANLGKINERLIDEGAYNFDGDLRQFKKIWKSMSYNFTACRELRVFGQQPEEFFAFSNAVFHEVDGRFVVDRMDELGVVSHNGENFYAPAFSKIYSDRRDDDPYEQDRNLIYKDIPEDERLSFQEWAELMNDVYRINDNGKWAVLFTVLCAFRDFIYLHRKHFTSLFFIGPTSSGKTNIAESIRNVFIDSKTNSFNLNTGTDASFFMFLERLRNVVVVMDEYNDVSISPVKFQGLKSAVFDGEGKIKVRDVASKTLDSSKINAIPIILGQEAAQQDDGALSNRCILCQMPHREKGDYSDDEKAVFERLKAHERIGLCNIAVDILKLRPLIKKYFLNILACETKLLREAVRVHVVNSEGFTRILNAVAMVSSMCRFLELHAPDLKLPFRYDDFFPLACAKVLQQLETISSSNKLSIYFSTVGVLINQGSIRIGRELKVAAPGIVKRKIKGGELDTEDVVLNPADKKVLFLRFNDIYDLYRKTVSEKDLISRASLRVYFEGHEAFIGQSKSTVFQWQEVKQVPRRAVDASDDSALRQIVVTKTDKNTSAYMFDYDRIKQLMNIDFEREEFLPESPATGEVPPPSELPF